MAFLFEGSGIAASIFLALFVIYTAFTIRVVYEKGIKSIYTSLLLFGIFRVAGQLCGVAFASLGYEHYQWLIAYLVFSAEGYFVLILTSFHLIAQAQIATTGKSWIRPTHAQRKDKQRNARNWCQRVDARFPPSTVFHMLLIPANAFIIAGGSILAGQTPGDSDPTKVSTSKGLRTSGQVIFLVQTIMAIALAVYVYVVEGLRHCNIYSIFLVAPFILVRGIFGIMSIYVHDMNYYDVSNYTAEGFHTKFVIYEYVLATTMEFVTGCIYVSNYYFESRTSKKVDSDGDDEKVSDSEEQQKV
ncbi:hypothetical protein Cantr_09268 [Candida viswanathii]|uniref:Protein RTM1 n=1 Tax=Candida viswanathii TaxID=5486 RepID=A0A367Y9H2_9ASCO|nr:hypothetical protein Cantr_09268 [Candida viswanathii]